MKEILVLIGAHICTAPRPQKEAETLADPGYQVTVMGLWSEPELIQRDRIIRNFQEMHCRKI